MRATPGFLLLLSALSSGSADDAQGSARLRAGSDAGELVHVTWEVPERRLGVEHLPGSVPEHLDVHFQAEGVEVNLRLRQNRALLPSSTEHVLHLPGGRTEPGPVPEPCFYLGDVHGDRAGRASFSTCGGRLSGFVLTGGGALLVEPAPEGGRALEQSTAPLGAQEPSSRGLHRVRRLSNEQFFEFTADVQSFITPKAPDNMPGDLDRRLTGSATKYVEVVVVNDFSRYTAFGGQAELSSLAAHSAEVLNAVTTIYRTEPTNGAAFPYTIQIVLVGQHTFLEEDPWEGVLTEGSETDVGELLSAFHVWGETSVAAGKLTAHDNRVLLSGRDFAGSTVGYAGVSAMCDVARSGSINMCGKGSDATAGCAATVAHEMGHNFGMGHDSGPCPQSGLIMAAVGGQDASTQFSSCSSSYMETFFNKVYSYNGQCLENMPTQVFGDPVCGNGFREAGEDCDCGADDCSSLDTCCDGSTCQFADASYECSDAMGLCCENCRNVTASAQKVCREARNSCDLAETCQGGTSDCPRDVFVYPGQACTISEGAATYDGLCSSGSCKSINHTCSVDVTRDFDGDWDLSKACASYNDECKTVVCHDASKPDDPHACGQLFAIHSQQMPVPDGTPCWHPSTPKGQRSGMCYLGVCTLPHSLAVVPTCGNGGIDYGEECDCGSGTDSCCDCSTCKLAENAECSRLEPCCNSSCMFKAEGIVCRAATGTCDEAETCSGTSGVCPSDVGKPWGTPCNGSDAVPSSCYGKVCVPSLDQQCDAVTAGAKGKADRDFKTGTPRLGQHTCKGLMCCSVCQQESGQMNINGELVTDPTICSDCGSMVSSSTFTVNGVSNTIYLGAALEGTMLSVETKLCLDDELKTPESSDCVSGKFYDVSIGRCLSCDTACRSCTGPTNFDCSGRCAHGNKDSRGACPISKEQVGFSSVAPLDGEASASVDRCAKGHLSATAALALLAYQLLL